MNFYDDFNPRTPGGVRLYTRLYLLLPRHFNPRTPGGVRLVGVLVLMLALIFQSTHPGWGATAIYRQAL